MRLITDWSDLVLLAFAASLLLFAEPLVDGRARFSGLTLSDAERHRNILFTRGLSLLPLAIWWFGRG